MIDLYLWTTPNGFKPAIALEEMGLDYRPVWINIAKNEQFSADFLEVSPNSKIPAIVDHTFKGGKISIFESGAILQYLARKTNMFYGNNAREAVAIDEWVMWQVGGVGPMMGQLFHFVNHEEKLAYPIARYSKEVERLVGVLETRLSKNAYAAGPYSIADMMIYPWFRALPRLGVDLSNYPNVKNWMTRINARPAVRKALSLKPEAV